MKPLPAVRHLLSLNNEHHWSNLLAALIETDELTAKTVFGLSGESPLRVTREDTSGRSRPDIVIRSERGATLAVIEVKVLADLGPDQLERYEETVPAQDVAATAFRVVHPHRLAIGLPAGFRWVTLEWEAVLTAFAGSTHPWVAMSAAAALRHLEGSMPVVGPETQWCDLTPGEDFVIALRARQSWIFGQVLDPPRGDKALLPSSAGVSWVNVVRIPTRREGYSILIESEEHLPVRDWPKRAGQDDRRPRGLSGRLSLMQRGVTTSADFDWPWLLHLWNHYLAAADKPWVTHAASPRAAHDRDGLSRIRELGAPKHLGVGFGEKQTQLTGDCMFGARYFLGDVTLREAADDINRSIELAVRMADCSDWPGV